MIAPTIIEQGVIEIPLRREGNSMTTPQTQSRPTCDRTAHQTGEVTTGILSTAFGAVCFLVAFAFLRGTEQLLAVSAAGLLASGGVR
jgi:hypothetical protein